MSCQLITHFLDFSIAGNLLTVEWFQDDLDILRRRGLCTSSLQFQREELSKLSTKQRKVFELTKEDLLGRHGILRVFYGTLLLFFLVV